MKLFLIGLALILAGAKIFGAISVSWFVVILPLLVIPAMFLFTVIGIAAAAVWASK